jgi:glutamate racemase
MTVLTISTIPSIAQTTTSILTRLTHISMDGIVVGCNPAQSCGLTALAARLAQQPKAGGFMPGAVRRVGAHRASHYAEMAAVVRPTTTHRGSESWMKRLPAVMNR